MIVSALESWAVARGLLWRYPPTWGISASIVSSPSRRIGVQNRPGRCCWAQGLERIDLAKQHRYRGRASRQPHGSTGETMSTRKQKYEAPQLVSLSGAVAHGQVEPQGVCYPGSSANACTTGSGVSSSDCGVGSSARTCNPGIGATGVNCVAGSAALG